MRRALAALRSWLSPCSARRGRAPARQLLVNHLTGVASPRDRVDVRYVLDQAEIPTFQERGVPLAEVLRRKRAEVQRRLVVRRRPARGARDGRRRA